VKKTLVLAIAFATAGSIASGQALPPLRQLGPVTAVTKDSLGAISTIRQLSDGKVLVNDIIGRRVLLFDSTLANETVIADTTSATANAYGTRPGGLIAYRGDSTLFIDPASLSMLLIDPGGKIARVMSAPRAQDVGFLIGGPFGTPGFDPQGRLVYRAPPDFRAFGAFGGARGGPPPTPPDSAAIVRFDLATRKLDTVTYFKTPKINLTISQAPNGGGVRVTSTINPMPQGDDWALMPDGTIAIVRTRDFHIDWLDSTGKVTATPKIPFEWERLTDEQKVAFVDSAKTAIEKLRASGQFGLGVGNQIVTRTVGGAPGGAPAPASPAAPSTSGAPATGANATTTVTAVGPGGAGSSQLPPITMVSPSELPDYRPAFTPGSTRADPDGNLWIRTTQVADGRPVYDVVNRKGELIDRVQIPANRAIIGFGTGGTVYLGVRDGRVAHLEKARLH